MTEMFSRNEICCDCAVVPTGNQCNIYSWMKCIDWPVNYLWNNPITFSSHITISSHNSLCTELSIQRVIWHIDGIYFFSKQSVTVLCQNRQHLSCMSTVYTNTAVNYIVWLRKCKSMGFCFVLIGSFDFGFYEYKQMIYVSTVVLSNWSNCDHSSLHRKYIHGRQMCNKTSRTEEIWNHRSCFSALIHHVVFLMGCITYIYICPGSCAWVLFTLSAKWCHKKF